MKKIYYFVNSLTPLYLLIILFIAFSCQVPDSNPEISIVTDNNPGMPVLHGIAKLKSVLQSKSISYEEIGNLAEARGKTVIVTGLSVGDGVAAEIMKAENRAIPENPEALTVFKTTYQNKPVWVIGGFDDRGLMYAILEVANQISWSQDDGEPMEEVVEITEKPDVSERAISIYTMNRAYWESRFYDENYWVRYLDNLAQNRFNSLVVIFGYENGGFLAPCYPYFFDVEDYPDVRMVGITPQEQQQNLDALNRLISMSHERGIRFTVGIWDHIYRGGVQGGGIPGTKEAPDKPMPGLVWGVNAENLISYTKTSLSKFVKLVPNLDVIQFRMHNESGLKREEQVGFWSDVFLMMKENAPDLQLDLRAKELPDEVVKNALDIGIKFRITTKYWMEQMGMPFHPTQINPEKSPRRHSYADMLHYPKEYDIHWRLWNGGTSRILLWGDPQYVRRFAESTHLYDGQGYEVNEPLATKMLAQPHDAKPFDLLNPPYRYYNYEFERYWHFFQVFGRIGYNPATSPVLWQKEFESRFGKDAASLLEKALHQASWILPRIITSVYPYRGFPMTRGWAEKQRLGNLENYSMNTGSDIQQFANFDEEAQVLLGELETTKILPSMNSKWFEQRSEEINKLVSSAENAKEEPDSKEFLSTITDLKILSYLAQYHARRIPAAVSYRLFEHTKDVSALNEAIDYERSAIDSWRQIVAAAGNIYAEDLMMGVRVADLSGHWKDELIELEKDLEKLEQKRIDLSMNTSKMNAPRYKITSNSDWSEHFQIIHQPLTNHPAGEPLKIRIKVTNPSGIKWVTLSYRSVNQDVDYKVKAMQNTNGTDEFEAIILADQINPRWDFMYFFNLMDKDGHGMNYPDLNTEMPYIIVKLIR